MTEEISNESSKQSNKKCSASEYHNMTKQLIITMKQIMSKYISQVGSTSSKRVIIKNVWSKLTEKKHPTKFILKLIFDPQVNPLLLKK